VTAQLAALFGRNESINVRLEAWGSLSTTPEGMAGHQTISSAFYKENIYLMSTVGKCCAMCMNKTTFFLKFLVFQIIHHK